MSRVGGVYLTGAFLVNIVEKFNVLSLINLFCQANPLPHGLDKIPDVQGYLVLNSDGAVLAVSVNDGCYICFAGKT